VIVGGAVGLVSWRRPPSGAVDLVSTDRNRFSPLFRSVSAAKLITLHPLLRTAAACLLVASARAESVWLQDVEFAVTHDAGFGNAVFVAGSATQLGAWDPTRAVRLNRTTNNIWRGKVALPRGVATTWRPFVRGESTSAFTNSAAITWLLSDATNTPPAPPPAPHNGKTIYYVTGWTNPHILWRVLGTTNWTNTPLASVSPGVFVLDGVGTPGRPLEFVPNNAGLLWDNHGGVSGANYLALPDAVWLRDGQIYDDQPPASFTAPRSVTNNIISSYTGITNRRVRVLLPRNYDLNTNKVYPVVYFHDGQNVFDPGGAFGSWSADAIITRDTAAGLLREMIVVAVDNSDARMSEYRPPGDLYGGADGIGDRYCDFLVNNVKPWVDTNFRVSPRREDHAIIGSSLGGLITHYIGMTSDVFGLLGICSPSYWIAPNFRNTVASAPNPDRRIWLDWGSSEGASMWDYGRPAATTLDGKGMVRGCDLQVMVGAGDEHNEAAWQRRLPELLRFLLPVTDGPNRLLLAHHGAPSTQIVWQSGTAIVQVPALRGFGYGLQTKTDLSAPGWTSSGETPAIDPWGVLQFSNSASGRSFYRIQIR
jgi:predicted alpha/beta superfamily hydrolase